MEKAFVNIFALLRIKDTEPLPSYQEVWAQLYRFAKILVAYGFPAEKWLLPGDSKEASMIHSAFTSSGPTDMAITWFKENILNQSILSLSAGVWRMALLKLQQVYLIIFSKKIFGDILRQIIKQIATKML